MKHELMFRERERERDSMTDLLFSKMRNVSVERNQYLSLIAI